MTKSISASVGSKGGVNKVADVCTVKELLNKVPPSSGGPGEGLAVDGICGPKTLDTIQKFQLRHFGWKGADGRVDPNGKTLAKLNEFDAPAVVPPLPVPAPGGSSDFRWKAESLLLPIPPFPFEVTSNGLLAGVFTMMTGGVTHKQLVDAWAKGSKLTTCNAFTGWFAQHMGSKTYLGRFDIEQVCAKAWVPVDPSGLVRPHYGDILRFKKFHVGVALDFVGNMFNTAESGQGGAARGCDVLKRKQGIWDPGNFMGWVDLEKWIAGQPGVAPKPKIILDTNFG